MFIDLTRLPTILARSVGVDKKGMDLSTVINFGWTSFPDITHVQYMQKSFLYYKPKKKKKKIDNVNLNAIIRYWYILS